MSIDAVKKREKKKIPLLLLMTEQVQAALRTKQAGEPAGHTAGIALHKDHLHTRVDIMLDYNGLNVNRRLFCSPSDEEWGSRSCRHRSLFPLSVPRQPGNWSSPWLRGSGAVTARLSIRCRWLHSRAVLTIAGHLSQTDPLLSPSFLLSPPGCLSVFVSAHRKCAFFNRPLKDQSAALLSTVQRNSFINETNSFHIKLRL